jgi:peroxiredoxin Q/BCP
MTATKLHGGRLDMAMVKEGTKAPDFKLASTEGGPVALKDLRGKAVVLYFYPKDDTPGCTREACAFRDEQASLKKTGAVVLGVSGDSLDAHDKFKKKYKLNFPLLSDPDKAVAKAYGAWGEKVLYGKKTVGMIRSTFVIDGEGMVRKVFPKVKVDGHAEKVLEALRAL